MVERSDGEEGGSKGFGEDIKKKKKKKLAVKGQLTAAQGFRGTPKNGVPSALHFRFRFVNFRRPLKHSVHFFPFRELLSVFPSLPCPSKPSEDASLDRFSVDLCRSKHLPLPFPPIPYRKFVTINRRFFFVTLGEFSHSGSCFAGFACTQTPNPPSAFSLASKSTLPRVL